MNYYCLEPDDVIGTNLSIVGQHLHAVTGRSDLEGALARPLHTWGGNLLYPTLLQRAGALLHGLVHAHAFFEGNKRTAWVSTVIYMEAFGACLGTHLTDLEVADFVEGVANHSFDEAGVAMWLAGHLD